MNLLPEMQHVEVILLSGIIAVTVFTVVTAFVSTAVYLATRERAHNPEPVVSQNRVPENASQVEAKAAVRSPLATAG
ncbi:MAG: hypothetical protein K8U57_12450 [Planctomycetes bacterium]|nr:hypothetical protein [Planctomycetota bacterium]